MTLTDYSFRIQSAYTGACCDPNPTPEYLLSTQANGKGSRRHHWHKTLAAAQDHADRWIRRKTAEARREGRPVVIVQHGSNNRCPGF